MSAAKPQLQVQSRKNGLVIALPNHQNIGGLAKHFQTRGDNELVFSEIKTTGRKRANADAPVKIGSPAAEDGADSGKRKKRETGSAADDLA